MFSGLYTGWTNGAAIVTANSGSPVTSLNITQSDNQLQAVDNNGIQFQGIVANPANGSAVFNMSGSTTAGNAVTINGTLTLTGTNAVLTGVWVEPSAYSSIYAAAVVAPVAPVINN